MLPSARFASSSRSGTLANGQRSDRYWHIVKRNIGCRDRQTGSEGAVAVSQFQRQNTVKVLAASVALDYDDSQLWEENCERMMTGSEASTSAPVVVPINSRTRPLRINLDLALYRARTIRQRAWRQPRPAKRKEMLEEVESLLLRCLAMDPTDGRPYVTLGRLYVQLRRFDEAEQLFDQGCTATRGNNAYIWTSWANLEAKRGNASRARKLYDAATVADEAHAAAWHGWGLLEKREGNFLRARDLWLKGIQKTRDKPNPYLYQSLAVLAVDLNRPEEARKWFQAGTKSAVGSQSQALWQAWALLEAEHGDAAEVRRLFRRGLEVSPRGRYTHLAWAVWEKQQGKLQNARELLQRGHKYNRTDPALLQAWALLESELGEVELARELLQKAVDADPTHLYVWQAWGVLEFRQDNLQRARELFQQGVWADPGNKDVALVFQAWAVLERKAGYYDAARELFKCAIKADPKSTPSWLAWASMEEDLGLYFTAKELRSRNLQSQVEVVLPKKLLTEPEDAETMETVRDTLSRWFASFGRSARRGRSAGTPEVGNGFAMKNMGNMDGMQLTDEFFTKEERTSEAAAK